MNGRSLALQRKIGTAAPAGASWRTFAAEAAGLITRAVGGDAWCVAAADPATLLMTDVLAGSDIGGGARFLELEYGEPDYLKQRDMARGGPRAGALSQATGGRLDRSARWRELIEPFGLGDQVRGALVSRNACWGYIGIERAPGSAFTVEDVALLADVTRVFGEGMRVAMLAELARAPRSGLAFLVLADDLSIVSTSSTAALFDVDLVPGAQPPVAILSVAAQLRARGEGPVTTHMASPTGWVTFTASWLRSSDGDQRIAVVAQSARPDIMQLLSATYRFTRRETDIVRLVLRGSPTAEITRTLHISALTVQQHLKSIFQKADVGSRGELVGRVLEHHFLPLGGPAADPD